MPAVWIEGQLVQITQRGLASTVYLTIRDMAVDQSLPVTVSRRTLDSMAVPLVDGARVVMRTEPSYWTKRGQFSLHASDIRPIGLGELLAQVEHLKRVLAAEGLFAAQRKRPLPYLPQRIGLICGRDSAAEHDVVVNVVARCPAARFDIRRVAVQGAGAVDEVNAALASLDATPHVDVIVIARGGGSVEDLLPFSNEALLRAVADVRTPVVSAIGHESDSPLLDLVADRRASTPTDSARHLVPDVADESVGLQRTRERLRRAVRSWLDTEASRLADVRSRPAMASPLALLTEQRSRVEDMRRRGRLAARLAVASAQTHLTHLRATARALSPAATMDRGYAVLTDMGDRALASASDLTVGADLTILMHDGQALATVNHVNIAAPRAHPGAGSDGPRVDGGASSPSP